MAAALLSEKQMSDAKMMFRRLDTDHQDALTYAQVHRALEALGLEIKVRRGGGEEEEELASVTSCEAHAPPPSPRSRGAVAAVAEPGRV